MSNYITQYQLTPDPPVHDLESLTWFFKAEVLSIKHFQVLN